MFLIIICACILGLDFGSSKPKMTSSFKPQSWFLCPNKQKCHTILTLADHKKGNSKWIFKFKSKNKEN